MSPNNNNYPTQYIEPIQLRNNTIVQLRPVHTSDAKQVKNLEKLVSRHSLYQRFLGFVKISDKVIKRFTNLNYSNEMAIVAEIKEGPQKQIIGVARIARNDDKTADFAIIIADKWQGCGLGKMMTKYILDIAKDLKYETVEAQVFSENTAMLRILNQQGFELKAQDAVITNGTLNLIEKEYFIPEIYSHLYFR